MFLQEKVKEININLEKLNGKSNIVIWGAGIHTGKLFEKTNLLLYKIKEIVDIDIKKQENYYYGFIVKSPKKIIWNTVDAVLISVPNKEKEIIENLTQKFEFTGMIITLYSDNQIIPFYNLYDKNISEVRYLGDYNDWNTAFDECKGYGDNFILEKVINATKRVLSGEAAWERDSYLFFEKKYVYRICAAILRCALQNKNKGVRILDIGGALGSTFIQNRSYLIDVNGLEYVIAEQENYARYGHENLENNILKFVNSNMDYRILGEFDIVLMSASLQYIQQYKEIISKIIDVEPHYIILDRILISNKPRICKETVPEEIYKSSYPVMIYTEEEVINFFENKYEIIEKDISSVPEVAYFIDGRADSRYYVFKKVKED